MLLGAFFYKKNVWQPYKTITSKEIICVERYARSRLEKGDCPCCGDRWHEAYDEAYDEGTEEPSVYDRPLGVVYKDHWGGWMKEGYETVVHFADGTMKWYYVDNTENTNP